MKAQLFEEIRKKEKQMSPQEEVTLFYAAQSGCSIAHDQLLFNHARFAIYEASKWKNNLHEDDLIQCSLQGISEAISKFDPKNGAKFITFAVWYIKKHIDKYKADNFYTIKIPARLQENIQYASSFSYDSINVYEDGTNQLDSILSVKDEIYNDLEEEENKKKQIQLLLSNLKKSQRDVIFLRLTTEMSFKEIALKLGYTTGENARQYYFKGIERLKKIYKKEQIINLFF